MKKEEMLRNIKHKDDKFLLNYILDKYFDYVEKNISNSTFFFDEKEFNLISNFLNKNKIKFSYTNFTEIDNKRVIYFGDKSNTDIFKIKNNRQLEHRDILGTLFSAGLDNRSFGDIFVENDCIYFSTLSKIKDTIRSIYSIKNSKITIEETDAIRLTENHFETTNVAISSMRLDTIITKLVNCSRKQATKLIEDKKILLNYEEETKITREIKTNDVLSIRKNGKYKIGEKIGETKKNNYIIEIIKYR